MLRRTLAGTNLDVSVIGFGTGSLHHHYSDQKRLRLLGTAFDVGITHFDTSPAYGYGLAEVDLGKFVQRKRQTVTITTKVGLLGTFACENATHLFATKLLGKLYSPISRLRASLCLERAMSSFEDSLRRLRTDYVDFLLLHEPRAEELDADKYLSWFESLRDSGKIRYWGIAGVRSSCEPVISKCPELAQVVQTKDSMSGKDANYLLSASKELQFTYGYLNNLPPRSNVNENLKSAVSRNSSGCVLFSSRNADRIAQLAKAVC